MNPVLRRKIIKGEQRFPILFQTLRDFRVLRPVHGQKAAERRLSFLPARRHPDFIQGGFRFRLLAFRQLVEDIGGFVPKDTVLKVNME